MQVLCLPTGTAVDLDEITEICQIIRLAVQRSKEIGPRLRTN
jgi:hypothetical protein